MIKKSFFLLFESFGYFLACMGLDVLFFLALGFFTAPVSAKMGAILLEITAAFSSVLAQSDSFFAALFHSSVMPLWRSLLLFYILFLLIAFIAYVIFQSVAWWMCFRIAKKKINYWSYLGSFFVLNLFWFLVLFIFLVLDLAGDISRVLYSSDFSIAGFIAGMLLVISAYFAVVSYVIKGLKSSFVNGWRHRKRILPCFFVVFLYFFVLNLILSRLFLLNYYLAVVIGFVLFLPALVWARVYLILNIQKVK